MCKSAITKYFESGYISYISCSLPVDTLMVMVSLSNLPPCIQCRCECYHSSASSPMQREREGENKRERERFSKQTGLEEVN